MALQNEDDLPRRSKLEEKGRRNQKFRNFIRQIDTSSIQDLTEDDEFLELEYNQKFNRARRM
jgi:hypothetical protein